MRYNVLKTASFTLEDVYSDVFRDLLTEGEIADKRGLKRITTRKLIERCYEKKREIEAGGMMGYEKAISANELNPFSPVNVNVLSKEEKQILKLRA